jgi:membrane peptidoglycan carboxypeptidase
MKNPSKYDPIKEPEAFKERFERVLKTAMIERIIKEEITFYDLLLSESLKNDF